MNWKVLIFYLLIFPKAFAQEIDLKTFDSADEGLFFDQVLIYEYSDHTGKSGEIWIYLNSCNNRLLFDNSAWGREDEMIHYIIAQQDGSYITFGTEAEGSEPGKVVMIDSVFLEPLEIDGRYPVSDDLVSFEEVQSTSPNPLGLDFKSFTIKKAMDPRGKESIGVTRVDFDTRLIYHFNSLGGDLQIHPLLGSPFPYLHPNDLITIYESRYQTNEGKRYWHKLELVAFEHTTYWAPVLDFVFRSRSVDGNLLEKPIVEVLELTADCH
ncbi:hypothetical protein MM236_01855 [Belliella sp. DSM 107340]|uniref:Uncharacterized protein n=1 Tax=Belliella calami TaxID=2923436 RepID=A0ABS9UJA8_9BACT|nr:hypothetical protein [Belliella calami]MCH7396707.1 hypothetical protein [Belliella calami]